MLDDIRKGVEASLNQLSKQAPDAVGPLVEAAQKAAEQLLGGVSGILEWTASARDGVSRELKNRVPDPVKALVPHQVRGIGPITRNELEALAARVDRLERGPGSKAEDGRAAGAKSSRAKPKSSRAKPRSAKAKKADKPSGASAGRGDARPGSGPTSR